MFKKLAQLIPSQLSKVFKTEDSRFILSVGIKVSGISLLITTFVYWFLYQVMRVNYAFFKAQGFPAFQDETPFFDFVLMDAAENLQAFFYFHIILFFTGCYLGLLILKPFKVIGDYCEVVIHKPNTVYEVETFNTYQLLTRFSEFFFEFLRESRVKNKISSNSIPPQFSRIHKPKMDKIFMLHFGLLLIVIAICSAWFIIGNTTDVYTAMVELAMRTLKDQSSVSKFFSQQVFILDEVVILTITLIGISYIFLGFHLYAKVSGAAFAIFSTMRSYMKGNYSSRVHLVGYGYLRDYTRRLNKYLDFIQNYFFKEENKK